MSTFFVTVCGSGRCWSRSEATSEPDEECCQEPDRELQPPPKNEGTRRQTMPPQRVHAFVGATLQQSDGFWALGSRWLHILAFVSSSFGNGPRYSSPTTGSDSSCTRHCCVSAVFITYQDLSPSGVFKIRAATSRIKNRGWLSLRRMGPKKGSDPATSSSFARTSASFLRGNSPSTAARRYPGSALSTTARSTARILATASGRDPIDAGRLRHSPKATIALPGMCN